MKPVEFALQLSEGRDAGSVSMHLEGTTWKLSGIGLPPRVLSNIVDRLSDALAHQLAGEIAL
ncbi:hypothetical protein [Bradyrhizobium sp. Ghvi]|uniref:hypothetical protein n=1 Tax=Bradyrhizobium sp. Ghvi TaxID=1855319 RepID=UPI001FCD3E1F|nr:hypothetical protein [Bradyrhizobium sp. Ghvi]